MELDLARGGLRQQAQLILSSDDEAEAGLYRIALMFKYVQVVTPWCSCLADWEAALPAKKVKTTVSS